MTPRGHVFSFWYVIERFFPVSYTHLNMERPGPLAAHSATDVITQEIREALKKVEDESLVVDLSLIHI